MGQFRIVISAIGNHGCERAARPGDKLHRRCGKLSCPDCFIYDFVQQLKMRGIVVGEATFTHWPGTKIEVVDDLVRNERQSGQFP